MLAQPFEKPVHVWDGLSFPRQLNTVFDAYQFASDWGGNSPEQRAATRACKAALAGEVDPETARGVFVAFARSKDILLEDATVPIWRKSNQATSEYLWTGASVASSQYPAATTRYHSPEQRETRRFLGVRR